MTELPTHMTNVLMLSFKNTYFQCKPLKKKKKELDVQNPGCSTTSHLTSPHKGQAYQVLHPIHTLRPVPASSFTYPSHALSDHSRDKMVLFQYERALK